MNCYTNDDIFFIHGGRPRGTFSVDSVASLWEFQLFSYSKSFFLPCLCNSQFKYLLNKPIYFSPADIDLIFNFQSWSQKQQNVQQIIFLHHDCLSNWIGMTGMDICGYERIKKPKWCGYSCFFGCYLCLPYEYSYYTVHFFLGGVKKNVLAKSCTKNSLLFI